MLNEYNPLLRQTKTLLSNFHLHAKKGLGQHFLVDSDALEASIAAAQLSQDDTVIEVGPGLGVLTEELAKAAKNVIAIELDARIASLLTKRLSHLSNVTIRNENILEVDIPGLFQQTAIDSNFNYKVVANLPYYVAAPTLRFFLENMMKPRCMVVMVQKEVAESIVALPGKMNILSISIQLYGKPSIVRYVPADSFYPPPKVDSAIVHIEVYDRPVVPVEIEGFFQVVKAGFSAPRKQLRNSLAKGLTISPNDAADLLNATGISPQRRAETLTLEEWAALYRNVHRKTESIITIGD